MEGPEFRERRRTVQLRSEFLQFSNGGNLFLVVRAPACSADVLPLEADFAELPQILEVAPDPFVQDNFDVEVARCRVSLNGGDASGVGHRLMRRGRCLRFGVRRFWCSSGGTEVTLEECVDEALSFDLETFGIGSKKATGAFDAVVRGRVNRCPMVRRMGEKSCHPDSAAYRVWK